MKGGRQVCIGVLLLLVGVFALDSATVEDLQSACAADTDCARVFTRVDDMAAFTLHVDRLLTAISLRTPSDDGDRGVELFELILNSTLPSRDRALATVLLLSEPCQLNEVYDPLSRQCVCRPGKLCSASEICRWQYDLGSFYFLVSVFGALAIFSAAYKLKP